MKLYKYIPSFTDRIQTVGIKEEGNTSVIQAVEVVS